MTSETSYPQVTLELCEQVDVFKGTVDKDAVSLGVAVTEAIQSGGALRRQQGVAEASA